MFERSHWVHMRLPFSWVLAPVFLLALSQADSYVTKDCLIAAVCQFLFLFPASHAFNSYYDRDVASIAGVMRPPPVERGLLAWAWLLDTIAVAMALVVSVRYAAMIFFYGLVSKAYSHPRTRLKALPWVGWAVVSFMQGSFLYFASAHAATARPLYHLWGDPRSLWLAAVAFTWIAAGYPLTQVYQHEEDRRRGDRTLSLVLGTFGTFRFAAVGFAVSTLVLAGYAVAFDRAGFFWLIQLGVLPSFAYFLLWFRRVLRGGAADFRSAMKMSWWGATGLNLALCASLVH